MDKLGDEIIAGAIFDFAGFLTCLQEPFVCGSKHEAARMVQLIEEWAAKRDLPLDNALVQDWQAHKDEWSQRDGQDG